MEITGKSMEDMMQGAKSTAVRFAVQLMIATCVGLSTWTINHVAGAIDKQSQTLERQGEAIAQLSSSLQTLDGTIKAQAAQNDLRFQAVTSRAAILDTRVDAIEERLRALEIRVGPVSVSLPPTGSTTTITTEPRQPKR